MNLWEYEKVLKWGEHLRIKEEINFNIMQILENQGVSVAFPSRSLYLETPVEHYPTKKSGEGESV